MKQQPIQLLPSSRRDRLQPLRALSLVSPRERSVQAQLRVIIQGAADRVEGSQGDLALDLATG
jgi:hypothetical protein